jgi:hypothetical protein
MSPPHGGFDPDGPNQQTVAEDIFDEYGGITSSLNSETRTTFTFAIGYGDIFAAHADFLSFRFSG